MSGFVLEERHSCRICVGTREPGRIGFGHLDSLRESVWRTGFGRMVHLQRCLSSAFSGAWRWGFGCRRSV